MLRYQYDHIDFIDEPVDLGFDCPLDLHCTYTRDQLLVAMRLSDGKDCLMVFDFVDNASQYNMPQSLHRLFQLKDYYAGGLALAPQGQKTAEEGLYAKGEKPDALIDWPVEAIDYELVDIFNWQEEASGMISQMEFVRRVDVQSETIERYVRDGLLVPDLVVPMRTFYLESITGVTVWKPLLSNCIQQKKQACR